MIKRDPLRPTRLEDYLGQEQVTEILKVAIQAAKERHEPLDHVLLNGPPGLGKTTLANIIANELGWKIRAVIAPSLTIPRDVASFLRWQPEKTILFIDEVHRLRRPIQEVFYPVLEDGQVQMGVLVEVPPMIIIGATTTMGKLEQPFIDRFPLQFQLKLYDEEVLDQIAKVNVEKLGFALNQDAIMAVCDRSRGTPRVMNNLLRRLRDYAQVDKVKIGDVDFANSVLWGKLGIDEVGLDENDRAYLEVLARYGNGVGLETLAKEVNQSEDTVADYIEPWLLRLGFVQRQRNGRWITDEGKKHLKIMEKTRR